MSYEALRRLGVTFRPIDRWPGEPTRGRRHSQFSARFSDTITTLSGELRHLHAKQVVLQIAMRDQDLRLDGMPRANATAMHPGVILAFDSKYGPLKYATDGFTDWRDNLRAIALSMEALRKVDRYGVSKRGEQYTGWAALPASTDPADAIVTLEQARAFLDAHGGSFKDAARKLHPDAGGDPALFRCAVRARDLIGAGA